MRAGDQQLRSYETMSYLPMEDPKYQPAWQNASILEANLVLEGGGMRGLFTAGVLDFLMDEGLMPRYVIGVSAGALNGFNYVAGMRGRSYYLNTTYCKDWRYFSFRSFLLTGNMFNVSFIFNKLINDLEPFDFGAFRSSPIELTAVCSNLETGEADYTRINDPIAQLDYVRASASMPLISRTVFIDGKRLLDGGMCDSVPIAYSQRMALDAEKTRNKHIVILTQDEAYIKKPSPFLQLLRLRYHRYPLYMEPLKRRHIMYNDEYRLVKDLQNSGEIFVLRPPEPVVVVNMEHDAQKLTALYTIGYTEARRNFSALQNYLEV